jgi:hypothetical protein
MALHDASYTRPQLGLAANRNLPVNGKTLCSLLRTAPFPSARHSDGFTRLDLFDYTGRFMDNFLPTVPVALRGPHPRVLVLADSSLIRVLANFLLSIGASHCANRVTICPEYTPDK